MTRINPNRVNLDLIIDILHLIDSSEEFAHHEGAVLVFLPGLSHIQTLYQLLEADSVLGNSERYNDLYEYWLLSGPPFFHDKFC